MRRLRLLAACAALVLASGACVDFLMGDVTERIHGRVLWINADAAALGSSPDNDVLLRREMDHVLRMVLKDTTFDITIERQLDFNDLVLGDSVQVVVGEGVRLTSNPPIVPIRRVLVYRFR